jgi:hypothetical protein
MCKALDDNMTQTQDSSAHDTIRSANMLLLYHAVACSILMRTLAQRRACTIAAPT